MEIYGNRVNHILRVNHLESARDGWNMAGSCSGALRALVRPVVLKLPSQHQQPLGACQICTCWGPNSGQCFNMPSRRSRCLRTLQNHWTRFFALPGWSLGIAKSLSLILERDSFSQGDSNQHSPRTETEVDYDTRIHSFTPQKFIKH